MSPLIRNLTIVLLLLPPLLGIVALIKQSGWLGAIALFMVVVYASVWLGWRPVCFRITDENLTIAFPLWQRLIPLASVTEVRVLDLKTFLQQFGDPFRVGAAGLWGGFGWLWTSQGGWVEFYVSRSDQFILVGRSGHPPLLITPRSPHDFVATLEAKRNRSG
ncbi:PH domain-containing protein [Trichothermofontia sp.]